MTTKKVFSVTVSVLVGIILFMGYYIARNAYKQQNQLSEKRIAESTVDVSGKKADNGKVFNKIVDKDAEILFKVQPCEKSVPILERSKMAENENLVGKNGKQLEEKYKSLGYEVEEISNTNVKLVRKPIKYQPNRYVLLAENNEIVIAKSDGNGKAFDKNGKILNKQGTGTNINSLIPQDIENIIKGDSSIQFDTVEKLNDGIRDFDIRYEIPE